jgi:alkylhydroperoxidase/carboxymuconolactone decarboxylase family protein YurZ
MDTCNSFRRSKMPKPPTSTELFKKENTALWNAFEELSKQCHEGGPLDEKTRRLVKVALAIGAGVEGGTHSAVRHAKETGISNDELKHVAILAITTLGFPSAMRGLSWMEDLQ